MVIFATLCYLRYRKRILLLRKAPGLFGEGKWNAPGGKLFPGESPSEGAVREMLEETGLKVGDPEFHGILNFYLGDGKELDQIVFVFSCEKFSGKLQRSKEGELRWFPVNRIPLNDMWEDDRVWLQLLLKEESFVGDFYFSEKYKRLIDHKIRVVGF